MTPSRQETRTCAAAALSRWAITVLESSGVPQDSARLAAGILVRTSLRGIDTHGLSRLPAYVEKLVSGEVNAKAQPKLEVLHGLLHCDGDGGLGQVVAVAAIEQAIEMARSSAVVACTIHSSGHLAALGTLVLMAAEHGMAAVLCQRTPPVMSLPGAQGRAIGNNPLAFAMPVAGRPPLVFDMAHSVVARGHLMQAVREGRDTVPLDWAIGPDGQPTTDPLRALEGAMQPIAGYKGLGMAMLVECLAGSFAGGSIPSAAKPPLMGGSPSNVSAFLLVMNPALAVGQQAFDANVNAWLAHYLEVSGPAGRYPGQRQAQCELQRSTDGIPLPTGLLEELRTLGDRMGRPFVMAAG
jgi:LDH2 family malate/lactate/ureidoglycolate dehydrogenase